MRQKQIPPWNNPPKTPCEVEQGAKHLHFSMLQRRAVICIRPAWRCRQSAIRRSYSNGKPNIQSEVQSSTAVHPSPLETSPKRLALYNTLEKLKSVSHAELEGRFNLALGDLKEWDAPFRIASVDASPKILFLTIC